MLFTSWPTIIYVGISFHSICERKSDDLCDILETFWFAALGRLRAIFGKDTVNQREVVSMIRTRWHADQYTRGSYSYPAVGE